MHHELSEESNECKRTLLLIHHKTQHQLLLIANMIFAIHKVVCMFQEPKRQQISVLAYLQSHPNINEVIFTVDWHNAKDGSFKAQGGHGLHIVFAFLKAHKQMKRLIQACLDKNIPYQVIRKGEVIETEEYGAFQKITPAVKGKKNPLHYDR